MSETLIKVENVSKKFCRDFKKSLWYGVKDMTLALFTNKKNKNTLRTAEFWAVKDVSFELKRGECLGLIGHNGAGKSTLLKMLNGLIRPDQGKITMHGRIGALIELGAGFNPILTGRENIYNNGAVLGFSKKEIDAKLDAIIEFSEIGEFIDTPVQNYSSGMKVRLGFAVAAQLEPDVLLIDEVLAVGDIGFQTKCFNRINELLKVSAIIFVSHSMPQVGRICSKLLLLDHGKFEFLGADIARGIALYHEKFKSEVLLVVGEGKAKINSIKVYSSKTDKQLNSDVPIIKTDENIIVDFNYQVDQSIKKYTISVGIFDNTLRSIALIFSKIDNLIFENDGFHKNIKLEIPNYFTPEKYTLNIHFFEDSGTDIRYGKELAGYRSISQFKVIGSSLVSYTPIQLKANWTIN
jgi:lipopolysaccharide transport system ATP-binding protein